MVSNIKLISISGKGNLAIQKDEQLVASLNYKSWMSRTASSELDDQSIQITAPSIWKSTYLISKAGKEIGSIKMNWKGNLVISYFLDDGETYQLHFKLKGFWKQHYELTDEEGNILLIIRSQFLWRKFKYEYPVTDIHDKLKGNQLIEILLFCAYCINLIQNMQSAAASGAAG